MKIPNQETNQKERKNYFKYKKLKKDKKLKRGKIGIIFTSEHDMKLSDLKKKVGPVLLVFLFFMYIYIV